MTRTSRPYSRLLMITLVLGLLLPLMATRAEAGHRSHFSWSFGFHTPFHFSYYWAPFSVHYYPHSYWGSHWGYQPAGYPPRRDVGAIRLKVKPKKTEIFLDGDYVGRSGKYDGYPGYLWLDKGSHTLVFYREGFRTFARTFEVRAGMITEVRVEMEPGETLPPEEFLPPPGRQRAPERPTGYVPEAPPSRPTPPADQRDGGSLDLRGEGARVRVTVEPGDASVYLDGRFLGTGEDLSRLHGGLMLDAGEHEIEVVHPDFLSDRVSFRAKAGEEIEIRVTLDAASEI